MTPLEIRAANAQINMSRDVSDILDNLKVNHPTSIDWEQRRYEIAKDVFCHHMNNNQMPAEERARLAVRMADKLIEELKKK